MQGVTLLPLHGGRAPRWLFERMTRLSGLIAEAMIDEYGERGFIGKLSDPNWLQALSCAIGYDWHSSGTTTVTIAALKEALNYRTDVFIAGGKGRMGTSTTEQIAQGCEFLSTQREADRFTSISKSIAKIDSGLVYNSVGIYHHAFVFSRDGHWCVVQQGMMGEDNGYAVRFQVMGDSVNEHDIANETNNAVSSDAGGKSADLTYAANAKARDATLALVNEDLGRLLGNGKTLVMPARHAIAPDVDLSKNAIAALRAASDMQLSSYQELLGVRGIGARTLRSLAIISSLVYETQIYERDPITYAYNLGGKDGVPYMINKHDYDSVVGAMSEIVKGSAVSGDEMKKALRRLGSDLVRAYGGRRPAPTS